MHSASAHYRKAFETGFETKCQGNMLETESIGFPSLEVGDMPSSRPKHRRKQKHTSNGTSVEGLVGDAQKSKTQMPITQPCLNPIILRGSNKIRMGGSSNVHLPPVPVQTGTQNDLHKTSQGQRGEQSNQKSKRENKNNSHTHNELQIPSVDKNIHMKTYTVLPPIGSQNIVSKTKNHKTDAETMERRERRERRKGRKERRARMKDKDPDKNESRRKEPQHSATSKKHVQMDQEDQPENKVETANDSDVNDTSASKEDTEGNSSKKQKTAENKESETDTYSDFVDIDASSITEKPEKEQTPKIPKSPSEMMFELRKKTKIKYRIEDIEQIYESEMLAWIRHKGRRGAICQDMDPIYADLAVIVRHNLLIQHLEEICMF